MTEVSRAAEDFLRVVHIDRRDSAYPISLTCFLGGHAPELIFALGNLDILQKEMLALFCSIQCPGNVILKTYDLARALCDANTAVIGGFHTPMEKECLELLLRRTLPIVICPARGLERMRLSPQINAGVQAGRILLISSFELRHRRITAELADQRNRLVAALASMVFVSYAAPGGKTEALCREVIAKGKPLFAIQCPENADLLAMGAQATSIESLAQQCQTNRGFKKE